MSNNRIPLLIATLAVVGTLAACATPRETSTAVGAGVGGVAGAVLTGGSPEGTAIGAGVGAVVGNQVKR
jgi:osmotically inducible lipoprotein OsmB